VLQQVQVQQSQGSSFPAVGLAEAMTGAELVPPPPGALERAASGTRAWIAKREEKQEALKRAASIGHDLSRNILDAKVEALERSASQHSNRAAPKAKGSAAPQRQMQTMPHHPRWGDMTDEDEEDFDSSTAATSIWGRGGGRRDVLIRNLPNLTQDELELELKREFARLWEATGRDIPPEIESIRISKRDCAHAGKASMEALVVFMDPYNAWLLVEHCGAQDWSSSATPTLHGQILQVEWPPTPPRIVPVDFRKFAFRADTDASSQISYNTIGTANSRSSAIAKGVGYAPSGKGASTGKAPGDFVPPQNRTVILAGIPTNLKEYNVKGEVLSLLQRIYQKNGFTFDAKMHLHKEMDGIEVRQAANRQDENGGTVKIRLRNYADAVWLVEQASGLRIAGSKLKAYWAQPRGYRENREAGKSSKGTGGYSAPSVAKSSGKGGYR